MAKALILCAGNGSRWGEYLGVPKQLITINNETLLDRTVRLLNKNGNNNIEIVSNDHRLRLNHCAFYRPSKSQWIVETLLSTRDLWKGQTIILLGDVFYTERAIQTIVSFSGRIRIFGRPRPSRYTKCNHGEIFTISFNQDGADQVARCAEKVLHERADGGWANLWDLYHSLVGSPLNINQIESKVFNTIDDFTDDFDVPEDYDRSIHRYNFATSANPIKRLILMAWIYMVTPIYFIEMMFIDSRNFK